MKTICRSPLWDQGFECRFIWQVVWSKIHMAYRYVRFWDLLYYLREINYICTVFVEITKVS